MPFVKSRGKFKVKRRPLRRARPARKRGGRGGRVVKSFIRTAQVADATMLKFKYSATVGFNCTAGVPAFYQFAGNSLYDPDISGTGHQPLGFDQWSAFYNKYCVTGSKIRAVYTLTTTSTVAQQSVKFCLVPLASDVDSSVITSATDITQVIEQRGAKWRQGNVVTALPSAILSNYLPTYKVDGVPKMKITIDNEYTGLTGNTGVGTSPGNLTRWILGVQSVDDTSNLAGFLTVDIVYYAKMYDKKALNQS